MLGRRLIAVISVGLLIGCAAVGAASLGHNPLAGRPLFVEPGGTVANAIPQHPEDAAALAEIAGSAQAHWFVGGPQTRIEVDRYVSAASAAAATPMVVLYAIPQRDCQGQHSAGGVADADDYRRFVAAVRAGIGGRPAVVIIEPDALVAADCFDPTQRTGRIALLRETVTAFAADQNTVAYLDAGHSRWMSVPELTELLQTVGVDRIRGVSLNVSNFFSTLEVRSYGEQLSAATGVHFVIDTSRNGVGPGPTAPDNWCNPPGRALGQRPEVLTGPTRGHLDALLWIKRPGESDGACRPGEPTSGRWFNAYALGLIANAHGSRR